MKITTNFKTWGPYGDNLCANYYPERRMISIPKNESLISILESRAGLTTSDGGHILLTLFADNAVQGKLQNLMMLNITKNLLRLKIGSLE